MDILFQDQVGARGFRYDTNPAAPDPAVYLAGLYAIAERDSKRIPLATEDGHDRLVNDEVMFCGLSWPWLPNHPGQRVLYSDLWPETAFRVEPLAAYLAHDSVLLRHHDLGGFILHRRDLVTSLAFGYGMSFALTRDPAGDANTLRWLDCLAKVQASVASRFAGQPLDAFAYVTRQVIRSRWGGLDLLVNLGDGPHAVDADTVIAPIGFHARADGLQAGIYTRFEGQDRDPAGWWVIRDGRQGEKDAWTFVGDRL